MKAKELLRAIALVTDIPQEISRSVLKAAARCVAEWVWTHRHDGEAISRDVLVALVYASRKAAGASPAAIRDVLQAAAQIVFGALLDYRQQDVPADRATVRVPGFGTLHAHHDGAKFRPSKDFARTAWAGPDIFPLPAECGAWIGEMCA